MKDGVIKQDGTSRLMRANLPATYEEFKAVAANGTLTLDILFNATGWQQLPTFLNKANLLKDTTAALFSMDNTAVPDDVFERLSHFTPTGAVFWLASETVPEGFLLCDGSSVSRTDYSLLFQAIGTAFGNDDDATFKLPDLRAKFVRGAGSSGGYSATFGVTQTASELRYETPIRYFANSDRERSVSSNNSGVYGQWADGQVYTASAHSVRPYNIALTPVIKYL